MSISYEALYTSEPTQQRRRKAARFFRYANRVNVSLMCIDAVLGAVLCFNTMDANDAKAAQQQKTHELQLVDELVAAVQADGFSVDSPHEQTFSAYGVSYSHVKIAESSKDAVVDLRVSDSCTLHDVNVKYDTKDGRIMDAIDYTFEKGIGTINPSVVVFNFANDAELQSRFIATGKVC